jgi:hypothetical protein
MSMRIVKNALKPVNAALKSAGRWLHKRKLIDIKKAAAYYAAALCMVYNQGA